MRFNTTTVMLALLLSVAWLVGCVDVPSNGPEAPVIESEYRFLNVASDLASVSIDMDLGPDISGLAFGSATSHGTYPSGNRSAAIAGDETIPVAVTAEQRATIMLLPKTGDIREFVKLIERRIFDLAALPVGDITLAINDTTGAHIADTTFSGATVGALRVVTAVPGATYDITIQGENTTLASTDVIDNSFASAGVAYRTVGDYKSYRVGSYTISVAASADPTTVLATKQVTLGASRQTCVVASDGGSGIQILSLEDN